jgi:NTP pyrophosphatase (non-canonical NTP hydrolase)
MSLTLKHLCEVAEVRSKEWKSPEGYVGLLYSSNEMAGEVGEFCNEVKKLVREGFDMPGSRTTLQKLKDELADVVICVANMAHRLQIDLDRAVVNKFNETTQKVGLSTHLHEDVSQ